MVTNFQIVLDSPNGTYYAGTNVTGRLHFTLDRPESFRAINIQFTGVARTSWSEMKHVEKKDGPEDDGRLGPENVTFTATEEYFSNNYNLVNSEIWIPPGDHVYPFSTILPPTLPSSFESKHGNIRYTVKAHLYRPIGFSKYDHHIEKVFQVVTPVDLNYNAQAKMPVELELEKNFCCCWCKSGPLTLVISLPYTGFVPGQNIPITLEVDNASNVKVANVVIKLLKVLKWKVREPEYKEKEDKVDIVKLTLDAVEPHGSKCYTQQIAVPVMPPCNLEPCSIISCSYILQVTAEVSGCHGNLSGEVPIFLGTVPIHQAPAAPPVGAPYSSPSAPALTAPYL